MASCTWPLWASILPEDLAGKAFWVGRARVPGVIGLTPPHLTRGREPQSRLAADQLRVDIGAAGREQALERVRVGDHASFATALTRMGDCVSAKALDDRLGVAILVELLGAAPPNVDLLAAFTVQEEVGLRGAGVAAHSLDPEVAIAVDCTPARDLPRWDGGENTDYNTRLGLGPALYTADRATVSDQRLLDHFEVDGQGSPDSVPAPPAGRRLHRRRRHSPGTQGDPDDLGLSPRALSAFGGRADPDRRLAEHGALVACRAGSPIVPGTCHVVAESSDLDRLWSPRDRVCAGIPRVVERSA